MTLATRVFDPLPQNHVATTLAMDGNGARRQAAQPGVKTASRRQRCGMKLGIAAGQPHAIGAGIGRFVAERREDEDLSAGRPPAIEQMGIEKGEGAVPGDRDTLSRWRMFLRRTGG